MNRETDSMISIAIVDDEKASAMSLRISCLRRILYTLIRELRRSGC